MRVISMPHSLLLLKSKRSLLRAFRELNFFLFNLYIKQFIQFRCSFIILFNFSLESVFYFLLQLQHLWTIVFLDCFKVGQFSLHLLDLLKLFKYLEYLYVAFFVSDSLDLYGPVHSSLKTLV